MDEWEVGDGDLLRQHGEAHVPPLTEPVMHPDEIKRARHDHDRVRTLHRALQHAGHQGLRECLEALLELVLRIGMCILYTDELLVDACWDLEGRPGGQGALFAADVLERVEERAGGGGFVSGEHDGLAEVCGAGTSCQDDV
jgi:hypothetical protein